MDLEGIPSDHVGVDETGNGAGFCNILAEVWQRMDFHRCCFAGAATTRAVSDLDPTPANQKYANKVCELWHYAKELIRHNQLFNISDPKLISEMTSRRVSTNKSSTGYPVTTIESKRDMTKRTKMSPDIADAMAILLDVIREKKGITTIKTEVDNDTRAPENWVKFVKERCMVKKANRRLIW